MLGFSLKDSLQFASFSNAASSYCCGYFPGATPFMSATVTAGQSAQAVFPKENSSKTKVAKTALIVIGYRICISFVIKNYQGF